MTALSFDSYDYGGHSEMCLRSAGDGAPLLIVPPLFEEMHRMRRMIAQLMRELSDYGIGALLPDLPGTNESGFAMAEADLKVWNAALTACREQCGPVAAIVALRGGCLLMPDNTALPRWHGFPVAGNRILRKMERARQAAARESGESLSDSPDAVQDYGGYRLNGVMREQLNAAEPVTANRTVRLESDNAPADAHVAGQSLWLRAEAGEDDNLSRNIARELREWLA